MGRLQKQFSFQSEQQIAALNALASRLAKNPSSLVQAIADHDLIVDQPLTQAHRQAMMRALVILQEQGAPDQAVLLAERLLRRDDVVDPFREEIQRLSGAELDWVAQARQYMAECQPFMLHYHQHDYSVHYAEWFIREQRSYLHAWCAQLNPEAEDAGLAHNRVFRLDQEADVALLDQVWRFQGLDTLEVTLQVQFSYSPKPEDIKLESVLVDGVPWTQVTKQISSIFWLLQDIQRYGDRVIVVSPASVRQLVIDQLRRTLEHYL